MKQTASTSMQMGQQLNLTPQLLQSIRLLQFNALELEQEIRRVLELNPLLEVEEEPESPPAAAEPDPATETAAFDELPEPSMWDAPGGSWHDGMDDGMQRIADGGSSDPMVRILERAALELPAKDLEIAAFWLEHCDDAGYLAASLDALTLRACARFDRPAAHIEGVRQALLAGDPAGVAAQDLRECLLAQLAALPAPAPGRPLAARILESGLDLLAAHDMAALARRLQREEDDVAEAARLILLLDPRPAEAAAPQTQSERQHHMLHGAVALTVHIRNRGGERDDVAQLEPERDRTATEVRADADDHASARRRILLPLLRADRVGVVEGILHDPATEHGIRLEKGVRVGAAQSPDEICIRRHQCDVCGCVGLESRTGIAAAQPQPEATEEHFGMGADERAGRQHELVVRACGQSAVCGTAQETGYGCPVVLRRCRRDTKQERTCGEDHHACEHFASRVLRRTAAAPS